jgi:hypothetical protein
MTLLTPALLALGLATAIPLVLHLLQRSRGPRVVFPALRYLRRAEREHASRIRLRQLLLLALRVSALLLLAVAAARPFLTGAGADHEATAVVILLDNSLSSGAVTGDQRVLDALKQTALETLDAAGPDDRFWLIRAGQPWEPAVAGTASEVARAVRAAGPAPGRADLNAELERAASILANQAERTGEIHLLSDLQATGIQGVTVVDVPVGVLDPGDGVIPNRSVARVGFGGGMVPRSGERVAVTASIPVSAAAGSDEDAGGASAPARAADSVTARLVIDDAVRAAARVAPGATAVLSVPARSPGLLAGYVEIDAADDRRYFAVRIATPPAVALTRSLPFLDEAIAVLADAGRLRRVDAGPEVVVAPAGDGVAAVRRGSAVVVLPPSSPLEVAAANQRLEMAGVPWRYEAPLAGEARIDTAGSDLADLLRDIRLRQVYGLTATRNGDSVLVRLRGGAPWAVSGSTDEGRYVLLASPLVPEAGTIPTSAAMLPLLDRAVNVWAAGRSPQPEYVPGERITLPDGDSIRGPSGSSTAVQRGAVLRLVEPGVHVVLKSDEVVEAYAVNPRPEESDLTRLTRDQVMDRIRGDVGIAEPDRWQDVIFHRRLGREITTALVVLALALLALESAVAAVGRPPDRAAAELASPGGRSR